MLPGLQAFLNMPRRRNHQAKPHLYRLAQMQSPMSPLWCSPQHRASLQHGWHTAAGGFPRATAHGPQGYSGLPQPCGTPGQQAWQTTLLHTALHQQTPDRRGAMPGPTAQDSSSPCLQSAERKNSLVRGKYKALCCVGPAAGFLEARKRGPTLHREATFRRTLRMLICLPGSLCPPPAPHCCEGYLWLCLSHKWGEAAALPTVFRSQHQAVAQLPPLSVSSEQE